MQAGARITLTATIGVPELSRDRARARTSYCKDVYISVIGTGVRRLLHLVDAGSEDALG